MAQNELQFHCHFDNCSRSFKRRDRLEIHLRTHTGERPFLCVIPGCSRSYARSQHLSRHVQRVHLIDDMDAQIQCPQCDKELANWDCLKIHQKRFHSSLAEDDNLYKCPEEGCSEVFRKRQQLVSHREKDHDQISNSASRCHKCPHDGCGKTFSFPNVLKRHLKTHEGYKCDMEGCDEVLHNWTQLRKHKATDHSAGLLCHTCQCSFKTKAILVQHLKIHKPTKDPVTCPWDDCTRTFLHKKNLTQHIRAFHEGKQVFIRKPRPRPADEVKKRRTPKKKTAAAKLCGLNDRTRVIELEKMGSYSNEALLSPSSSAGMEGLNPRLGDLSVPASMVDPASSPTIFHASSLIEHDTAVSNSYQENSKLVDCR